MTNDLTRLPCEALNKRLAAIPRLLVSVRDDAEAELALAGGCDILDIKDPSRGSLGMADSEQIAKVIRIARKHSDTFPVSIALGETIDGPVDQTAVELGGIISEADAPFVKLGTAGLAGDAAWIEHWKAIRSGLGENGAARWIMVAYADAALANGPHVTDVIAAAASLECSGVLIDTFSKSGGGLFEWLAIEALADLATRARELGLLFALAGKLQRADLSKMASIGPDIVGIRSAACREGRRTGVVCPQAIREFKSALRAAFPCQARLDSALLVASDLPPT